ncbi:MAG: glycosyltransferase family 9 protein [Bacteroidota bacterium]
MRSTPGKILIIRLSSIGDIVLTSPVIRSLRRCQPEARIHFLTKEAYAPLLAHHPGIDQLHLFAGDLNATVRELRAEGFDYVLDLHRSLRSRLIKARLRVPASTYEKDRWPILLYMRFRWGQLPTRHTVERYATALQPLGCGLDGEGLEFFLPEEMRARAARRVATQFPGQPPIAVVLGGKFATKKWPTAHFIDLLNELSQPVILIGGPAEAEEAQEIAAAINVPSYVAAGQGGLLDSAALMTTAQLVITHDTGLMHIAVALRLPVCSLWGSTVPEIGFAPYRAENALLVQHPGPLDCRPCSKLGHAECPKGHFRCMRELTVERVQAAIQDRFG